MDSVTFEVAKMTGCAICAEPVIYLGPKILSNGERFCSDICFVIDRQRTPGRWIDASELAPGGSLHDRPELWLDD